MVENQFFWESRKEYLQILDLFVSKKISLDQFFTQFCDRRRSNINSARMWKNNLEEEVFVFRYELKRNDEGVLEAIQTSPDPKLLKPLIGKLWTRILGI